MMVMDNGNCQRERGPMAYENTTIGRTYGAIREWWEEENRRGIWNGGGKRWEVHPSWSSPADRENWHRNWGELLNFHTTAHIRRVPRNGVTTFRLRIRVTHPDLARLELVKAVTGGSIEGASGPRTVHRLEIENVGAFQALKVGRWYVDPANSGLIEVLDAAMHFYRHVPEPGQPATDAQTAAQEYWEEHLDKLMAAYVVTSRPHDCVGALQRTGTADWTAPLATEGPKSFWV